MKRPEILDSIIQEAVTQKAQGHPPLRAIFDLDSTLFDVSPRITKILHAFAELPEVKTGHPDEAKLIASVKPHPEDYGVKRTLARYGFNLPSLEFGQKLIDFWKLHFFANPYLTHDVPYPGAVEYVQDLYKAGADIFYLTGRDVPRMFEGSVASLKHWGFPLDDDHANLVLKPHTGLADDVFKKDFFQAMDHSLGPVWFFENEPANIHLVLEHCPHIKNIFIHTVHSGARELPPASVPQVTGFII